jgi:hypothetical protein
MVKIKFVKLLFTSACISLALQGCDKEMRHHKHEPRNITIEKTLAYGEKFELSLNEYEDADDLSGITTQATDFTISQLSGSALTADNKYTFMLDIQTKEGAPNNETVILKVTENHPHHSCGQSVNNSNSPETEAIITLHFKIAK